MRLSIIIPTLNESRHVAEAVRRAGALLPSDVTIADGGSNDNTVALAAEAGCRIVTTAPGRARQQNAAARHADGDTLLFLHADTWLPPVAHEQISLALSDATVIGGAFRQRIDAPGLKFRALEHGNAYRARVLRLPFGDQGLFFRREVFERLGGFPEVDLMEDLLLSRAARRVGKLALLPGPLNVSARRWLRHGVVRQTVRNWSFIVAERLGVSPNRLAKHYRRHDS